MKLIKFILIFTFLNSLVCFANDTNEFNKWKIKFKKRALANNISEKTFNLVMSNTKFLPKVIEYDRFQPEFYEDTKTYINKRTSKKKQSAGIEYYKNNKKLIDDVEAKFNVEKELLLALMGIKQILGHMLEKWIFFHL